MPTTSHNSEILQPNLNDIGNLNSTSNSDQNLQFPRATTSSNISTEVSNSQLITSQASGLEKRFNNFQILTNSQVELQLQNFKQSINSQFEANQSQLQNFSQNISQNISSKFESNQLLFEQQLQAQNKAIHELIASIKSNSIGTKLS